MADTSDDPSASKEEDWHYGYHAVAFLDILGQREAFREIRGVPHDPAGETQLIEVLKRTVGFVPKFREGFQNIFETYAQQTGKELELPEEFREEFLRMRRSSIKLHGLSDAVVAWTSLMEEDQCGALNSIYGILMASAGMSALALACKHAIRGGIELDGAIPLEPGSVEIYGPALAKAYELESRHAEHPRILVGEGLLKYLKDMSVLEPRDRAAIHNKHMAEQCLQLIAQDRDGRFIVDYLGGEVLKIAPEAFPEAEVIKPARQFVKDEIKRFRHLGDQRLAARYERVLAYFDERLPGLRDADP